PGLPKAEEVESGRAVATVPSTPFVPATATSTAGGEQDQEADEVDAAVDNRKDRLLEHAARIGAQDRLIVAEAPHTLEADLLTPAGNEPVLRAAFLAQRRRSHKRWQEIVTHERGPAWGFYSKLRVHKKFISKGEFAHDVALAIENGAAFTAPSYLADAIRGALLDQGG
ncbi:hypothetical protein, partial [Amycolatopsis sp. KNN50.9b]|uniref:hypothetical protein n=1 Tax=Amycolatopsis sp. KNN50.9b TaxID=2018303 RepID=UPI000B9CF740